MKKLKLYGFNNLTKSLSFNIYDICYAKTPQEKKEYISYIDHQYNSKRLTEILTNLTSMIGAKVLNISGQDYDPQGASVTLLISDLAMIPVEGKTQVAHLDKSHVTVHTYPEYHPETSLATFRVEDVYKRQEYGRIQNVQIDRKIYRFSLQGAERVFQSVQIEFMCKNVIFSPDKFRFVARTDTVLKYFMIADKFMTAPQYARMRQARAEVIFTEIRVCVEMQNVQVGVFFDRRPYAPERYEMFSADQKGELSVRQNGF